MLRIVHTADSHLGMAQYHMAAREEDYYKAVTHVFTRARALNADLIILAGDMFDAVKPPARAVRFLSDLIRTTGIEVVGIDGNHDIAGSDWLKVCGIIPLHKQIIERKGVRITGLNSMRPALFYHELEHMTEPTDILVLHQAIAELANAPFADLSALEMLPALKKLGVRYVALGDIHDNKEMTIGDIEFVYPGSTEMTAINEARDKVFYVLDIAQGKPLNVQFESIPTRPVYEVTVRAQPELDNLLAVCDKQPSALILAYYDPTVKDLERSISEILNSRNRLFVCRPMDIAEQVTIGQLNKAPRERTGILARQEDAVRAYFEPTTDAYQLTCRLLQTPENVDTIVKEYMVGRGLT